MILSVVFRSVHTQGPHAQVLQFSGLPPNGLSVTTACVLAIPLLNVNSYAKVMHDIVPRVNKRIDELLLASPSLTLKQARHKFPILRVTALFTAY